ncbi:MAG: hypothetical protein LBJ89_05030 [Holosporales bacterium]|jgi:chromosome segregation ATPase|nr:hypothetical protein [Holosporales bacterium]
MNLEKMFIVSFCYMSTMGCSSHSTSSDDEKGEFPWNAHFSAVTPTEYNEFLAQCMKQNDDNKRRFHELNEKLNKLEINLNRQESDASALRVKSKSELSKALQHLDEIIHPMREDLSQFNQIKSHLVNLDAFSTETRLTCSKLKDFQTLTETRLDKICKKLPSRAQVLETIKSIETYTQQIQSQSQQIDAQSKDNANMATQIAAFSDQIAVLLTQIAAQSSHIASQFDQATILSTRVTDLFQQTTDLRDQLLDKKLEDADFQYRTLVHAGLIEAQAKRIANLEKQIAELRDLLHTTELGCQSRTAGVNDDFKTEVKRIHDLISGLDNNVDILMDHLCGRA